MSFFPLPHTATLETETITTDVSGQRIKSWGTPVVVNCLYMAMTGSEVTNPRDEFSLTGTMYVDGATTVASGARVVNIKDAGGNVIESGPFLVQSIRVLTTLNGMAHHKTLKLTGVGN